LLIALDKIKFAPKNFEEINSKIIQSLSIQIRMRTYHNTLHLDYVVVDGASFQTRAGRQQ
jgi:hypothetical protein